jgi:hypothetical protein
VTSIEQLSARLDRVEAELALHRLAFEYCVGADHRDRDRWRAVWTADAAWVTSPDRVFTGIDEMCAAVEEQWRAFPIMQHATSNHLVSIDGDHATGRCDAVVLVQFDRAPATSDAPPVPEPDTSRESTPSGE